ncbi:MAG: nucleotidyl transferase AbiEii/AbiGii toxin family protein [Deltaproteobacteria bacterium]|nr:MAG: nucleotidyl transferase AbiEii/AbiGii toxin family protein [Deltaproteobacteria bacterium]
MTPSKQDFFNNYRQSTIIEVVQAIAKSRAGAQIVFKGGTALKLFCGLPRYSEDIDYDSLPGVPPQELMRTLKELFVKRRWEITDEAIKYFTILLELRLAGPERRFRVKIEISTREKELETTLQSFRGVPILTLEPSFLMTEKLLTFLDRQAANGENKPQPGASEETGLLDSISTQTGHHFRRNRAANGSSSQEATRIH